MNGDDIAHDALDGRLPLSSVGGRRRDSHEASIILLARNRELLVRSGVVAAHEDSHLGLELLAGSVVIGHWAKLAFTPGIWGAVHGGGRVDGARGLISKGFAECAGTDRLKWSKLQLRWQMGLLARWRCRAGPPNSVVGRRCGSSIACTTGGTTDGKSVSKTVCRKVRPRID